MRQLPVFLVCFLSIAAGAEELRLAPNAPKDKLTHVTRDRQDEFNAAIGPYIAKAKSTYPDARARFLAGLPHGQIFFITTRLHGDNGVFEQVFVLVRSIRDGKVEGLIANNVNRVPGYKNGDSFSFPEAELLDWLIAHPDGSEEGNFVGKFMDTYQGDGS